MPTQTLDEPGLDIVSVVRPEGVIRVRVLGEAFDRLAILASGEVRAGDGATAPAAVAGAIDAVYTQAAVVAAPAALTAVAATGEEPPTEAEYNALLADVTALRTTVAAALVALKGTGKAMASA